MRTWAFIAVLSITVVAACGDNANRGGPACGGVSCDDGNPCNGTESCGPNNECVTGTPLAEGASCGASMTCQAGQCVGVAGCGDGVTDPGEECDDGNAIAGDGCEVDCKFTCLATDAARNCAPADVCAGQSTCEANHVCSDRTPLADGTDCGDGKACAAAVCTAPTATACGNGVRDPGEECDDGDVVNLDGCDSHCKLEQAARITSLVQEFVPSTLCTQNALGAAISELAQSTIQATWDQPVKDGSLSVVFEFLGLTGPLGPDTTTSFELGFVTATPATFVDQQDGDYDGTNDLDWWYIRDPGSVDANEVPTITLPGQISSGHITAGPGTITLDILFALQPARVTLFDTKVDAQIDSTVAPPLTATGARPPGHLASEHLDPAVNTFKTSTGGEMCSDVAVDSLFHTRMPDLLLVGCTDDTGDNAVFTETNTLFDAFVVGCNLFGNPAGIIATQPDGSRDGATYHFDFDPTSKTVTRCTRNGQPAQLAICVSQATYSSAFQFQSDRVIIHRN